MIVVNTKAGSPQVSFTPAFYKQAFKKYERQDYRDAINMMKRASVDSHTAGCLLGRRAGFQRDFSIIPFSEDKGDVERAEWISAVLKNLKARKLFKAIHEAVLYKYVVIDFEWEAVDNRQVPTSFTKFDQKYFKYKDGQLLIDMGKNLVDIPPEALTCETDDNPVLLPVLRDYIFKDFGLESFAAFLEVWGEGIIIGKYPPGSDDDVKTEIDNAVNAIARSSRGSMPDNATIDVIETNRSSSDHDKFIAIADKGISISILGHANAVENSKGLQVGDNQSGYKAKREISVDDMYFIEDYVQLLINTIHTRNFGDNKIPTIQLDKAEPVNVKEWLDVLDTGFNQGLIIDPSDWRKTGLKVSEEQKPLQKDMSNPFTQ